MAQPVSVLVSLTLFASLAGCGHTADLPLSAGVGRAPTLPAPTQSLIPTVQVAEAVGWRAGAAPVAATGLKVNAFAVGLEHPRWLLTLPNGDVLVAETAAPIQPEQYKDKSLKGIFMRMFMNVWPAPFARGFYGVLRSLRQRIRSREGTHGQDGHPHVWIHNKKDGIECHS